MPKDHRRHVDDDNGDRGNHFSDTSSSIATLENDEEERRRERRRKKSKKSHRRDGSDSDERRHRRHTSSKDDKKKKRHKKSSKSKRKKDRKRRKKYDDDSSDDSRSDDENDSNYSRRRRHKHSRKERKRLRKDDGDDGDRKKSKGVVEEGASKNASSIITREQTMAKALHHLFIEKPDFATEMPLILIRLAGGTTFDLSQVTDPSIANGLQAVFEAMEVFGVKKHEGSGMWMFQNPPGAIRRDELVLLRVVRSLLNDVGLTMDKVLGFDAKQHSRQKPTQPSLETDEAIVEKEERQKMKELTFKILEKFRSKDATLGSQLASLCMTIVDGESVSVDGIPDEDLKGALESLFQTCGLEKLEIEEDEEEDDDDDDDDDESKESPLMGYGLPADANDDVQMKLATIMAACREGPPKGKSIGPMRRPTTEQEEQVANAIYGSYNAENEDDEEDDGPLLPGEARKARGPAISLDMVKAQAEYRELELKSTAAGVPMPTQNGGREEWMINPGEHDFLSGIKSGQAIKGRGFQNKKSRGGENAPPVHPAVQAELDAIMQAHDNARGPSLIDLHQSKISREKELAVKLANGKNEFKWTRDNDLDAGRRVDKNALGMILGGAAENLKTKFSGGFNR